MNYIKVENSPDNISTKVNGNSTSLESTYLYDVKGLAEDDWLEFTHDEVFINGVYENNVKELINIHSIGYITNKINHNPTVKLLKHNSIVRKVVLKPVIINFTFKHLS